jgi:hypothetical protein
LRQAQRGFRNGCATLALSALITVGAVSHAHASAFKDRTPAAEAPAGGKISLAHVVVEKKSHTSGKAECEIDSNSFRYRLPDGTVREIGSSKMLDEGEKVHGVWCGEKRAFVLTSRKLIIVESRQEKQAEGNVSLGELFRYKDISGIYSQGAQVSFVATDDRVFVRTDRIREIPLHGDTIIHGDGLDVTKAEMILFSGVLFFAPAGGRIVADEIGTDLSAEMQLPASSAGGSFTEKKGKIYFGNSEIQVLRNPDGGFRGFGLR